MWKHSKTIKADSISHSSIVTVTHALRRHDGAGLYAHRHPTEKDTEVGFSLQGDRLE